MSLNLQDNRTQKIEGVILVNGVAWLFVQGMTSVFDAGLFTRDFIGTGKPVFTQLGDVIGSFNFALKNTVDIYKTGSALSSDATELVGTWIKAIAEHKPVNVSFVQSLVAGPEAGGSDDRIRISWDGRIMKPEISWLVDVAVDDVIVDGEILQTPSVTVQRDTNP